MVLIRFLKEMEDFLKQIEMSLEDLVVMESTQYLVLEDQVVEAARLPTIVLTDHLPPLTDLQHKDHLDPQVEHHDRLALGVQQQQDHNQTAPQDHLESDHPLLAEEVHSHQPLLVVMDKVTVSPTVVPMHHSLLSTDLKVIVLVIVQVQTPMGLDH